MITEREARMALGMVVEPGTASLAALVAEHGAVDVWEAVTQGRHHRAWAQRADGIDLAGVARMAERCAARFVIPGDPEWPIAVDDLNRCEPLDGVGGAPLGLWVRGAPLPANPLAMVGSRACSTYGEDCARSISFDLAQQGSAVISGGAYGIDAAAHRGCLAADGPTVAVLAGGVDGVYPAGHVSLFRAIRERGCLVSEHPLGSHPTRARFLSRNRVVAAMASGVIVVEAAARSGARSTASWAMRLGRTLMAVPGPIDASGSVTPHRLIRDQQAVLVISAAEVIEVITPVGQETLIEAEGERRLWDEVSAAAKQALDALPTRGSLHVDEVARVTGLSPMATMMALDELSLVGLAEVRADGGWGLGRRRADGITRRAQAAHLARKRAGDASPP